MSKEKIDLIRDWLNKNKIFFETIAVVLLAIMAIIVSWNTNQIVSYQTDIMKSEHLPIIHLDTALIYDTSTENYTRDELIISNLGAPLSEFESQEAIFFKVQYGLINKELKTALIPIYGYYFLGGTGNATGKLEKLANYALPEGNNYKAVHVTWAFSDFAQKKNAHGFVDLVRYIRVIYKDIFGEIHDEFYIASPLGTYRLNETEGKKIFKYYDDNRKNEIDFFHEVSSDLLYEKWSTIINESEERK
jgi:hypothetical protein